MGDPLIATPSLAPSTENLTRMANQKSPAAMREMGAKLEGVFMSMLVENMRTTMTEDGMFGSDVGADTYGGLFDRYIGESMAKGSPLGITDMIVRANAARVKEPDPCGPVVDKYLR